MTVLAIQIALFAIALLLLYPAFIVMLAAAMLQPDQVTLPVARLLRKRQTGRRFQRPVMQRAS